MSLHGSVQGLEQNLVQVQYSEDLRFVLGVEAKVNPCRLFTYGHINNLA